MSAKEKTLIDGYNNKLYPKSKTSAIYDNNNVKLSSTLADHKSRIISLEGDVGNLSNVSNDHETRIGTLETNSTTQASKITTLETKMDNIYGGGTVKLKINPTPSEIASFDNGAMWIVTS